MAITPTPTEPIKGPLPVWLRAAQISCLLMAGVCTTVALHRLQNDPTLIAGVWAALGVGYAGAWINLLSYGLQLRSASVLPTDLE
ncbi:hypothetical protein [Streptomyces sp. NPDC052042]|uniref:hypothetical protein n=1 Tax=unclassified Streptomyces TaxID=2593676 RepID=UPI0037D89CF8